LAKTMSSRAGEYHDRALALEAAAPSIVLPDDPEKT
jgi:hypothetical protein